MNGQSVPLSEHEGFVRQEVIHVGGTRSVVANVVDSTRTASSTRYQGIAFWVNNRLVGEPSWSIGASVVLDGRSRFAKRFAIVIQAGPEWLADIEPDWSSFKRTPEVEQLLARVGEHAQGVLRDLSAGFVDENSEEALFRNREDLRVLSTASRVEVAQFTQMLVQDLPGIASDALYKAVRAIIHIQKARSGASFLNRLLTLDDQDIEGLDRMLGQWSVQDALTVLDEIDNRLSVIAAIEKLAADPATDELHTLHPLVTQARWLFGPEYDSPEYSVNRTLMTVAIELFKASPEQVEFYKPARRPDLVALADATIGLVATDSFDGTDGALVEVQSVLLIELKRGKSTIGRDELNQAQGYAEDFLTSGIDGTPFFNAFVVGHKRDPKVPVVREIKPDGTVLRGRVTATTFDQLVRTANRRLHGLQGRIPSRYEDVAGFELLRRVMNTPSQAEFKSKPDEPQAHGIV